MGRVPVLLPKHRSGWTVIHVIVPRREIALPRRHENRLATLYSFGEPLRPVRRTFQFTKYNRSFVARYLEPSGATARMPPLFFRAFAILSDANPKILLRKNKRHPLRSVRVSNAATRRSFKPPVGILTRKSCTALMGLPP
jgi:hypothetical protein